MINIQPSVTHTARLQAVEASQLTPQKNNVQPLQEPLESAPPDSSNVRPMLSRSRRDLQNPTAEPDALKASVRSFAEAWVDQGDRQLAIGVANGLIRERLHQEKGIYGRLDTIDVPSDSTFGKVWGELADALNSEPFKSFAIANDIDPLKLVINPSGRLSALKDNQQVDFELHRHADWAAASSAVLAAAKKVSGNTATLVFFGPDRAPETTVARFYGVQLKRITSEEELSTIGQLLRDGKFSALNSSDPLDAPIKQKQREARQRIEDLPPQQLNQRLAQLAPSTAAKTVKEADQALAQHVSRAMMKLLPETTDYQTSITLQAIPEYSTFNLVRKNLLKALTGSAFTTFAQENNLDPANVRINPVSGELTGKVNGVNTRFTLNDVSGWNDAWTEIQDAVKQMAAGSDADVPYPFRKSALLYEIMAFYNEPPPHQEDSREQNWQKRQLNTTLGRIDEMNQNQGFEALIDPLPNDPASVAIQQRQQAVTQQLALTPLALSPLQALAAAVENNARTPVESEATPADGLARAEGELAATVHRAMLELRSHPTQAASKTIQPVPASSLFGQWWGYLDKALKGRGFNEWANKQNIDLASLRYDPTGEALVGKVNGIDQRFTAHDFAQKYPEHFDVLSPVLTAAQAFAAHGQTITLAHASNSSVPYPWVARFYSLSADPGSSAFEQQSALMGHTQQFPTHADDPQKIVAWLNRQKTAQGNSNDRYALIQQLKNWSLDSGPMRFLVDPDSSLQPKGITSVAKFLSDRNWYPTPSKAGKDNLRAALQTPVPQSPPLGNHWGFLSTDIPLNTEQRNALAECVNRSTGMHDNLLGYLGSAVTNLSTHPEQALAQLLSSDTALELASNLQTEMKGAATVTSLKQWLLTALVLELDPTAGTLRNTVTGFDFMGPDNSGLGTQKIRDRFSQHLIDKKGVPASLAPAIARLLMAGTAPQLLVEGAPPSVTLGSLEWVSFVTAVNRIERTAPSAVTHMSYQQVMALHRVQPISAAETQIQTFAQMNPVIDWAIINNHLVKNDKDEFSLEQLQDSQDKLSTQIRETSEARSWLRTSQAPTRRAMALEVLRKEFGPHIDYESKYMWESLAGGLFSGARASIVEIFEAGRLSESWTVEGARLDFERLRKRANEVDFPNINTLFDNAINEDFTLRRHHTLSLFKDMLSKLSWEERNSLNFGAVELLDVQGAGSGMVMTSIHKGVRRDFAVYPATGQVVRIADIPPTTPLGTKVSLEIDAAAFKNGTEPKQGVTSEVVVRTTDQFILIEGDEKPPLVRRRQFIEGDEKDVFSYDSGRINDLAKVLVDSTFLNKGQFLNLHRNAFSNGLDTATEPSDFFKAVWHALPGASSLEDLYHGEFAKAGVDLAIDIAIYAATEGAGKLWNLAKTGAAWAATKVSARFIETFGTGEAQRIVLKDVTAASTNESFKAVNRMQGGHLAELTAGTVTPQGNVANGTVIGSDAKQQIRATAVHQDEGWYAYDAQAMGASGPPLSDFRSDTSIPLKRETLPNGKSVLIPERLLPEDALVINRSTYADVRVGNKVYRYEPNKPDVLTDLESADHFNDTKGLEAFCPAGPRAKRGLDDVCFAKVVSDLSGDTARLVQGLEHMRLYPSPASAGKTPTIIFEHRVFDVVEKDGIYTTVQRNLQDPIDYLQTTRGTITKDRHFGLPGTATLANLEQNTRIVKLDAISSLSNDKRELRGTIALQQTTAGGINRYVVVEADALTFYYSTFDEGSTVLNFKKVGQPASALEAALVEKHITETEAFLEMAGAPLNKDFVALPTLNSAFSKLEAAGYSQAEINDLKTIIAPFSDEKKREFIYQLMNKLDNANSSTVLKSANIEALHKAGNFAALPVEQQNKFYAEGAKEAVDTHVQATGVGSQNKRSPHDLNDIYREEVADTLVSWIQGIKVSSPDYINSVLKFGAGNCGEMAEAATQIIKKSGGNAKTWYVQGGDHAFTVVGGPAPAGKSTVDFSQAEWRDAWIVDPWAEISCKASEYTGLVQKKMAQWSAKGQEIYTSGDWRSPLYPKWITELTTLEKRPLKR